MEIDLRELKNDIWDWYYEEYGRGSLDTLTVKQARMLYDCMCALNQFSKINQIIITNGDSQRP